MNRSKVVRDLFSPKFNISAFKKWLLSKEAEKVREEKRKAAEELIKSLTYERKLSPIDMWEEITI